MERRPHDHGRKPPPKSKEEKKKEHEEKREAERRRIAEQNCKDSAFEVTHINCHLEDNGKNHHTDEYDQMDRRSELVVRRGQPFTMTLVLNSKRPFSPSIGEITLDFELGCSPSECLGTCIHVHQVHCMSAIRCWEYEIVECKGNAVTISVMTSPFTAVGKYEMSVKTVNNETGVVWRSHHGSPVYILFNAWCPYDPVYMPLEEERVEYVLNERGMIWRRGSVWYKGKEWSFDQFDEISLDCALFLLYELSKLSEHMMGNPVLVCRALSALVNNCDDNGVLIGNWSGEYDDGVSPSYWDGSVEILKKYMNTHEPVKYGQCWVFSGILTTLGRTLGIPTRSVTNFGSAHDTDGSITIDRFVDESFNRLGSDDSIWNFHVWNDVWISRFDLPPGYDGWQAIDSTPQEASAGILIDNVMCCGPSPLKAIKEGDIPIGNDTGFIYAEVNADVVTWQNKDGEEIPIAIERDQVGTKIITKKLGNEESYPYGVDIKSQYKYPPGPEEDKVTKKAVNYGTKCKFLGEYYKKSVNEDVTFHIDLPEAPMIGDDVCVKLVVKNTSKDTRTVWIGMECRPSFYTGVSSTEPCKWIANTIVLNGNSETTLPLELSAEDYVQHVVDSESIFRVSICAEVKETNQHFLAVKNLDFEAAPPEVECSYAVKIGTPFKVKVSLSNPLPRPIEGGTLKITSRRFEPSILENQNIPPKSSYSAEVTVQPKDGQRSGGTYFQAGFKSKLLSTCNYIWINIKDAE